MVFNKSKGTVGAGADQKRQTERKKNRRKGQTEYKVVELAIHNINCVLYS